MTLRTPLVTLVVMLTFSPVYAQESSWQKEFDVADCNLLTTGRNKYFILEPGYQLILEADGEKLQITVLNETKTVDGILTRIVEEREWEDDEVSEISKNYFSICLETNDVFYFGEDVDNYEDGEVVNHDGAWLAGKDNKAGLIMPGAPKTGMKYYQEIAPGVAMDWAEIISMDEICETPAGTFSNCMKVKEGTALNIIDTEYKYYVPGIGLIQDEDLVLTKYGFLGKMQ